MNDEEQRVFTKEDLDTLRSLLIFRENYWKNRWTILSTEPPKNTELPWWAIMGDWPDETPRE